MDCRDTRPDDLEHSGLVRGGETLRPLRAVLLAGALALLGTGAHLIGGGGAPSTAIVVLVTAVTLPLFWWMGARPLRPGWTAAALVLGQGGWHAALALSGPSIHAGADPLAAMSGGACRGMALEAAARLPAALHTPSAGTPMTTDHGGWTMLLAHAVGALLFAAVIGTIDSVLIWLLEALTAADLPRPGLPRWLLIGRFPVFVQLSAMPIGHLRGVRTDRGPPAALTLGT